MRNNNLSRQIQRVQQGGGAVHPAGAERHRPIGAAQIYILPHAE